MSTFDIVTIGGLFIALVLLVPLYFLPTYVACKRRHPNTLAIFVLNLVGGLSGILWVVALVWACIALSSSTGPILTEREHPRSYPRTDHEAEFFAALRK